MPITAQQTLDKGEYVVFQGVYEGSASRVKAALGKLGSVTASYQNRISSAAVPDGRELPFRMKIPKNIDYKKAITDIRKVLK